MIFPHLFLLWKKNSQIYLGLVRNLYIFKLFDLSCLNWLISRVSKGLLSSLELLYMPIYYFYFKSLWIKKELNMKIKKILLVIEILFWLIFFFIFTNNFII